MKLRSLISISLYGGVWIIGVTLYLAFHILKQGVPLLFKEISLQPLGIPLTLKKNSVLLSMHSLTAIHVKLNSSALDYLDTEIEAHLQNVALDTELRLTQYTIHQLSYSKAQVSLDTKAPKKPSESSSSLETLLDEKRSPIVTSLSKFQFENIKVLPLQFQFKDKSFTSTIQGSLIKNRLDLEGAFQWNFKKSSRGSAALSLLIDDIHSPFALTLKANAKDYINAKGLELTQLKCETLSKEGLLDANCEYRITSPTREFPLTSQLQKISASYDTKKSMFKAQFPLENLNFIPEVSAKGTIALQSKERWSFEVSPEAQVQINELKKAFLILEKQGWAFLPAPLRIMSGSLLLVPKWNEKDETLSVSASTQLKSEQQELNLEALLKLKGFSELDAEINIKKAKLILPKIDPELKVFPDSRFEITSLATEKKSPFQYRVNAYSTDFILYSKDYQTNIPLNFSVFQSNHQSKMEVAFTPFNFVLFKQNARLNNLRVARKNTLSDFEVKGEIEIPYAEYRLFIDILGTLEHPRVIIRSDPYLNENQILALLLLGRPMDNLTSDELDTLGNAKRILTDATFNLVTLYFLASTPIEGIQWNPETKSVVVKVRLQDGTYLNVGSDSKKIQMLGFKQKIFKNLFLTTDVKNPFENKERSISSFIEWSTQY